MLSQSRQRHEGFTLIEALIAFVVLTVGLLGAVLFHGQLLGESTNSKSHTEANALLAAWLENQKEYVDRDEFNSKIADLVASTSAIQTEINLYTISWSKPTSVAGSSDLYLLEPSISWDDGESLISLSSYVAWLDPKNNLEEGDAGAGSAGAEYDGDIEIPTGNATQLVRNVIGLGSASSVGLVSVSGGVVSVVLQNRDELDSGTSANAIKLIDVGGSERFVSVYGTIYGYDEGETTYQLGSTDAFFDYPIVLNASDASLSIAGTTIDAVIDVQALAGANCAIYYVGQKLAREITYFAGRGQDRIEKTEQIEVPYAKYVCVAGEGWNGSIVVGVRSREDFFLASNDAPSGTNQTVATAMCLYNNRAYKYLIVENPSGDEFDPSALPNSVSIAGQSGLVSFEPGSIYSEGEYAWLNENFLVLNNNSTGIYRAGDVVNQDFIVYQEGQNPDCGTGVNDTIPEYQKYIDNTLQTASQAYAADIDRSEIIKAWPGDPAEVIYDVDNPYARWSYKGDVILGYVPRRYDISGSIYIDSGLASTAVDTSGLIELIGQPEPLVSVTCSISEPEESSAITGYSKFDYSCPIPKNWEGYLIAKPVSSLASSSVDLSFQTTLYGRSSIIGTTFPESKGEPSVVDSNNEALNLEIPTDTGRLLSVCAGDDVVYDEVGQVVESTVGPIFRFYPASANPVVSGGDCFASPQN